MAGLLTALGTALGGFTSGYEQERQRNQQEQAQRQQFQFRQQQLRAQQNQQRASALAYRAALSGGLPGGQSGFAPTPLGGITPSPGSSQGPAASPSIPPGSGGGGTPGPPTDLLPRIQQTILKLEGNKDNAVGAAGELGPGQIKPATGAQYGFRPEQLLGDSGRAASGKIAEDLFKREGGNPAATFAAYQSGPGAVGPGGDLSRVGPRGQQYVQRGMSELGLTPQQSQQSAGVARQLQWRIPPAATGQMDPITLVRAIEATAPPGMDDDAKFGALLMLQHFVQPQAAAALEQAWKVYNAGERREEFDLRRADTQAQREQTAEFRREQLGLGERRVDIAEKKAEASLGKPASPETVDTWAKVLEKGGTLPPGLSRTAGGSRLVQQVMEKMSADMLAKGGGADAGAGQLISNIGGQKANETSLRNMQKVADASTSFEETARRNFDKALELAPTAIPTELGPFFNRYVEEGETLFGDPNVPPYVAAMLTAANEYAKIMTGATGSVGSTVDSRKEAREIFSPYLSLPQIKNVVEVAKFDMDNRMASNFGQIQRILKRMENPEEVPREARGQRVDAGGAKYTVGQIIDKGGKKYRVTGGDLNGDPDVEAVGSP